MEEHSHLSLPADWQTLRRDGFVLHADPLQESALGFALSVASGLDGRPRRLDARYLYDASGSALFERITEQPEYYLTRVEDRLLATGARAIREVSGPGTLVELGSGASTKTRRLLDAWCAGGATAYVPVDVDRNCLEQACASLCRRYPRLHVEGLAASYERALPLLRGASPVTVAFLGSSLGNLGWHEYPQFCQAVAAALAPGDHFLIGLDLVKKPGAIEAAYNDAAGVTSAFTRNLFARMNRDLLTDVSLDAIQHVAFYDSDRERVEIFAEARREFVIRIRALEREFRIARGERILTEVSHKFRPESVVPLVERFGFRVVWTSESSGDFQGPTAFGLFLFRRVAAPPPRPPTDERARAVDLLASTRARTLELIAPLTDEDLVRQHSRLMSPIAWDLGHIAHFEQLWLGRALDPGLAAEGPGRSAGGLYDPQATPRAGRAELPLPSVAAVRLQMREIRRHIDGLLATVPRPASASEGRPLADPLWQDGLVINLVAQHEAQHQETMLQAIALRDDLDYRPRFVLDGPASPASRPLAETVLVPAGAFVMGTNEKGVAYDNERPAHVVDLPAFHIDRCPVTNGRYLAFMEDGGYRRRELWAESGWNWLQETRAAAPRHWRATASGSAGWAHGWEAVVFGRLTPLDPDCPVVHVSWHEADAYARWAHCRLPSEAEWEKAAAWDPARGSARLYPWGDDAWEPESARANLGQRRLEPVPAGAVLEGCSPYGCLQMLGDVWEWTGSWFDGYPGFQSYPYPEYSEIFFGKVYRVLRGGSFATSAAVARATFRNWDLPERRQIFAGFRCARNA